jgi:hypothetical protein
MPTAMSQNVSFFWRCRGAESRFPQPIDDNRHTKNARVLSGVQISSPYLPPPEFEVKGMRLQERTGSKAQEGPAVESIVGILQPGCCLSFSYSSYTNHHALFIPFCPYFRPSVRPSVRPYISCSLSRVACPPSHHTD